MNKKKIFLGLCLCIIAVFIISLKSFVFAADIVTGTCGENGDNITYEYDSTSGTLTFSGTGNMEHFGATSPDKVTTAPWRNYAKDIKKVTISDGITNIGRAAFTGCSNLSSIIVPSSVTHFPVQSPFEGCDSIKSAGPIGSGCDYEFGWKLEIPEQAFLNCSGLENVIIPNTIQEIGAGAFSSCKSLKTINLPEGIEILNLSTFSSCKSLKNIKVPSTLKFIEAGTFWGCISLEKITIPSNVEKIGNNGFRECSSLETIDFENNSRLTEIGDYAFEQCTNLKRFIMPNSVYMLGQESFAACQSLNEFTFSTKINTIPKHTFDGSLNMDMFILPNTIKNIDAYAFGFSYYDTINPENLTKCIAIPENTTNIEEHAFEGYFTIKGEKNSAAESFAKNNNLKFEEHAFITVNVNSTCKTEGYKAKKCVLCDKMDETIERYPLKEHNYYWYHIDSMGKDRYDLKCKECNDNFGRAHKQLDGLYYMYNTNFQHFVYDENCNLIRKELCSALNWNIDEETHEAYCKCDLIINEEDEHLWSEEEIKQPATLEKKGYIATKCKVCGKIKVSKIIPYPQIIKLKTIQYTYNGKIKKPKVVIIDSKGNTIEKCNYTVSYKNNKKIGTAKAKITFKGEYIGTKELSFKIIPKSTSIKKITAGKKTFKVVWNKQRTETTGYEIQYSTNSKFKSGTKKVIIKKNKTTSAIIKKLKSKKKYYVRIRTYRTVNGKKVYSSYSSIKNVKVK